MKAKFSPGDASKESIKSICEFTTKCTADSSEDRESTFLRTVSAKILILEVFKFFLSNSYLCNMVNFKKFWLVPNQLVHG